MLDVHFSPWEKWKTRHLGTHLNGRRWSTFLGSRDFEVHKKLFCFIFWRCELNEIVRISRKKVISLTRHKQPGRDPASKKGGGSLKILAWHNGGLSSTHPPRFFVAARGIPWTVLCGGALRRCDLTLPKTFRWLAAKSAVFFQNRRYMYCIYTNYIYIYTYYTSLQMVVFSIVMWKGAGVYMLSTYSM